MRQGTAGWVVVVGLVRVKNAAVAMCLDVLESEVHVRPLIFLSEPAGHLKRDK